MYLTIQLSSAVYTSFPQAQVFHPFHLLRKQLGAASALILVLPLLASHSHPGNPPSLPELLPTLCIWGLPGSCFPFCGGQRAWIGSGIDPCSFQAWKAGLSRSRFNDEREGGGQRGRGRPGMGDSLDQRSDLDGSEKRFRINRRPTRQQMMAGSPEKRKTHMSTQVKCSKTWDEGWEIHSSTLVWSGPCHVGSSQPGIKPVPAAVEAWSHKKARQVSTWVLWLYVTLQFSDPVS